MDERLGNDGYYMARKSVISGVKCCWYQVTYGEVYRVSDAGRTLLIGGISEGQAIGAEQTSIDR
jgi:hypothetical protein